MSVDAVRRKTMQAVKAQDTTPELVVRKLLFSLGYRYRLHKKDLPGKPDIVFPGRRKVVFVHGCFWHGHQCKRGNRMPKTNREYWEPKLKRNKQRDKQHIKELRDKGWGVLVVWECEVKEREDLARRLTAFLGAPGTLH